MNAWRTAALALSAHFGQTGFTAEAAVQAARQDPALDDALMQLAGSVDVAAVERSLHAHVGHVAHGLRMREWPSPTDTLVFNFVDTLPASTPRGEPLP